MGEEEEFLDPSNWGSVEIVNEKKTTRDKQEGQQNIKSSVFDMSHLRYVIDIKEKWNE